MTIIALLLHYGLQHSSRKPTSFLACFLTTSSILDAERAKHTAMVRTMRMSLGITATRLQYPEVESIRLVMEAAGVPQKIAVLALIIADGDVDGAARYAAQVQRV